MSRAIHLFKSCYSVLRELAADLNIRSTSVRLRIQQSLQICMIDNRELFRSVNASYFLFLQIYCVGCLQVLVVLTQNFGLVSFSSPEAFNAFPHPRAFQVQLFKSRSLISVPRGGTLNYWNGTKVSSPPSFN